MNDNKSMSADFRKYFDTDHLRSDLRVRALRGASFTVSAQAASYGIQTIGTIILARLLTPNDFGLVTMVIAFSLLMQNLGVIGFNEAVVQRKKIDHRYICKSCWSSIGKRSRFKSAN